MPFLFKGDFLVNTMTIYGVQYVTYSFYDGDKDLFQKVGDLIAESFQAANPDKITNGSSLGFGIAIAED